MKSLTLRELDLGVNRISQFITEVKYVIFSVNWNSLGWKYCFSPTARCCCYLLPLMQIWLFIVPEAMTMASRLCSRETQTLASALKKAANIHAAREYCFRLLRGTYTIHIFVSYYKKVFSIS